MAYMLMNYLGFMIEKNVTHMDATKELNEVIKKSAQELNLELKEGRIITSDVFDHYVDFDNFVSLHEKHNYLAVEMEAFALFVLAKKFKREASCLLTVVDTHNSNEVIPPEKREKALDDMIKIALEAIIK